MLLGDSAWVFIGAGRVASHLALALQHVGVTIAYVYSRKYEKANLLASRLASPFGAGDFTSALAQMPRGAVYCLCVADDAIPTLASRLQQLGGTIIHTSGSVALLQNLDTPTGVLYPLQTFSEGREIDLTQVPFFVEASEPSVAEKLTAIAKRISARVAYANSKQRRYLHLCAVLTNNFTNHLLVEAEQMAIRHNFPLEYLYPLMLETIQKAFEITPKLAQTGPARRGDLQTIQQQRLLLEAEIPALLPLYDLFTERIRDAAEEDL